MLRKFIIKFLNDIKIFVKIYYKFMSFGSREYFH